MAEYIVLSGCSHGKKGEVIDIKVSHEDFAKAANEKKDPYARMRVMLAPYSKPVVKVDESAEELAKVKAELAESNGKLEEANKELAKVKAELAKAKK